MSLGVDIKPLYLDTYFIISANISDWCTKNDGSLKTDGNYEWPNYPKCYIQCLNGKVNWQCCKFEGHVFVPLCDGCFRNTNEGKDKIRTTHAILVYKSTTEIL